jgi:TolB-like protein
MSNFFNELKNRNVYKAATAYVVTGWLIMQVVDTMSNNLEWPPAIASWITKVLIVGFPITLVVTWLYEVTPQGLKRTGAVQEDTPENRRSGKRLNQIIIGVLGIAICFMLVERVLFAGNVDINKRQQASIAVLPFANMSSQEENEYFADGLTDQILDELANLSGLQVTARTSSFKFKDKNEDVRKIGEELDVNYVLEGSVQFDSRSNRIKIIAQLINASNGYHLWSETYEDDFEQIFGIQEDVSRKVASQLRIQLLPEEDKILSEKLTDNTEAYKLYLRSKEFSFKRTDEDLRKAIDLLKQATELEPDFAEAHAELSFLYGLLFSYGSLSKEDRDEFKDFHLNRALEIAPNKPEVLFAKALNYMNYLRKDSSQVIADLRKAIELKPNYADAQYALFRALGWAEQSDLALKSLEKAVELDPLNSFHTSMLANHLFFGRNQHERAMAIADKQLRFDPNDHRMGLIKGLMLMNEPYGDQVEGFKYIYRRYKDDPTERWNLNYTLLTALNVDLWPLSEKIGRTIQLRYSDSWAVYNNLTALYYFKREYENARDIVDYSIEKNMLDEDTITEEKSWLSLVTGDPVKALEIFEEGFPTLPNENVLEEDFPVQLAEQFSGYIELLRLNGQIEKADVYSQKLCGFYMDEIKNDPMLSNNRKNQYLLDCYYCADEKEKFLEYLEEVFFVKKDRMLRYYGLKSGYYWRLDTDPDYQKLFSKIEAETHRQRAEVIEYLKAEGDWDPAWDKELGLDE